MERLAIIQKRTGWEFVCPLNVLTVQLSFEYTLKGYSEFNILEDKAKQILNDFERKFRIVWNFNASHTGY